MKIAIIFLVQLIEYSLLPGAICTLVFTLLNIKKYGPSLILGVITYILIHVVLPLHVPYLWTQSELIHSSILASLTSIIVASTMLGIFRYKDSCLKALPVNWALYSIQVLLFYYNAQNKPLFDYPNGPTFIREFWSYFRWSYLEANNPIIILAGMLVFYITRLMVSRKYNGYFHYW